MNRENFLHIYNNKLTPPQKEILPLFLAGLDDNEITQRINSDKLEVKDKITRTAINHRIRSVSERFGCPESKNHKEHLVEIFTTYKRELVSNKLIEKHYLTTTPPDFPDRPEPINSPFYIERDDNETDLDTLLTNSLIRISAPEKMGKTSLIKRIIAHSESKEFDTLYLDFSQIENSKLNNEVDFIHLFYNLIIKKYNALSPRNEWDADLSAMTECATNLQSLLSKLNNTFVLVMDEVDHLFKYSNIYENFFPLLRNLYEKGNDSKTWKKLKMVISYSTEDYGKLNFHQSPFNIGFGIKLTEFTLKQVQNLALRHNLHQEETIPLIELVGGHPYLLRLAFYYLFYEKVSLRDLLNNAATNTSIYQQHLLKLLNSLNTNPDLKRVFKAILNNQNSLEFNNRTILLYQLEGMGLIKFEGEIPRIRCNLYYQFFKNSL